MTRDLSLTRRLDATPDVIWRCWTDSDLLKRWFAPKPVETVEAVIEPRPGGRFFTLMRVPDHGDIGGEGCILVAEPARRLVWTNCMEAGFVPATLGTGAMDFAFSADIRLTPEDGGCRYDVVLRHRTDADRAAHEKMGFHDGWGAAIAQMEILARTL
jgi:uncharacterized protein YndB with AHSA1/START domain